MSTTRHLINRRRRAAAVGEGAVRTRPKGSEGEGRSAPAVKARTAPAAKGRSAPVAEERRTAEGRRAAAAEGRRPGTRTAVRPAPSASARRRPSARTPERSRVTGWRVAGWRVPIALGAVTVLLGGFAAFAAVRADSAGSGDATRNAALTDTARTAEIKGGITTAVNAVFSISYADTGKNQAAAAKYLTGKAVGQHADMLAQVRKQAPKQKLVLTTTVTDAGVELAEGDRARVLVFADQRNTRTDKDRTSYGAAMFAVDAVKRDGIWKIANIDTYTR